MSLVRILPLIVLLAGLAMGTVLAGHARHGRHCCPDCGHKLCVPQAVTLKTKKHCFEVECKDICIPAVKGPCAPCCEAPRCGRVRTVKVLKKVEFECEHCGYKWQVHSVCDAPPK
jgi:hypothetical protein